MADKKLNCPICGKWLNVTELNFIEHVVKRVLELWCKHCKNAVRIEI